MLSVSEHCGATWRRFYGRLRARSRLNSERECVWRNPKQLGAENISDVTVKHGEGCIRLWDRRWGWVGDFGWSWAVSPNGRETNQRIQVLKENVQIYAGQLKSRICMSATSLSTHYIGTCTDWKDTNQTPLTGQVIRTLLVRELSRIQTDEAKLRPS